MFNSLKLSKVLNCQGEITVAGKPVQATITPDYATATAVIDEAHSSSINIHLNVKTGTFNSSKNNIADPEQGNSVEVELIAALKAAIEEMENI